MVKFSLSCRAVDFSSSFFRLEKIIILYETLLLGEDFLPENISINAEFEAAVNHVNELPSQPTNVQLELYGFFKQALFGDITGERPGRLNVRARAKYDEWANKKGMSQEEAMRKYIEVVKRLEKSQK